MHFTFYRSLGALLSVLLAALAMPASGQTAGDLMIYQKSTGAGYDPLYITPSNGKVLGFNGSGTLSLSTPFSGAFSDLTGKPTTLSGYGITDAQPLNNTLTTLSAFSLVQGDLIYSDANNSIARLPKNTSAPRYLSNSGTNNAPAWSQVNLANGVTGSLDVSHLNGGAGASSATVWRGDGTWGAPNITASLNNLGFEGSPLFKLDDNTWAPMYGIVGNSDHTSDHKGVITTLILEPADGVSAVTLQGLTTQSSPQASILGFPEWNTAGAAGIMQLHVTDTSSDPASYFFDFYVNNSSVFNVDKGGHINVGSWSATPVDVAHGGTGQTTAAGALAALLPSQTGNSGKYLKTDGATASWSTDPGIPGGSSGAVQYNNGGSFAGLTGLTTSSGTLKSATLAPANDTTGLTLTGGSITGSGATPFINVTGTWNTTGAPTAFTYTITNTASDTYSKVFDYVVGPDSVLALRKDGLLTVSNTVKVGTGATYQGGGIDYQFSGGNMSAHNGWAFSWTTGDLKLSNLSSNGFLKTSGGDGTVSVDTSSYALASTWGALSGTSPAIGFTAARKNLTMTLSGDTTFTASGYAQGYEAEIFLTGDSSTRTLTFPPWTWMEGAPTNLPAGKHMWIQLKCTSTTEGSVYAVYGTEQ